MTTRICGPSEKLLAVFASFVIATLYSAMQEAPKTSALPVVVRARTATNKTNAVLGFPITNETDAILGASTTTNEADAVLGSPITNNIDAVQGAWTTNETDAFLGAPTTNETDTVLGVRTTTNKTEAEAETETSTVMGTWTTNNNNNNNSSSSNNKNNDNSYNNSNNAVLGAQTINQTDAYTIIMATFRRDKCLELSIDHYLKCNMRELRVKWQDFNRPLPAWLLQVQSKHSDRLVIDVADADYLSSRFKVERVPTSAVFPVDDDVRHPCSLMREGFRLWQERPRQSVGFAPRRVLAGRGCYDYFSVGKHIFYPLINTVWVTKGAFLHRDYLKVYFSEDYSHLRKSVDGNITGEDMLMSLIMALGNPPGQRWPVVLYSRHSPDDHRCSARALGKSGLGKRCKLLNYFLHELGFPLELAPFSEIYFWDQKAFVPFTDKLRTNWKLHHWPKLPIV